MAKSPTAPEADGVAQFKESRKLVILVDQLKLKEIFQHCGAGRDGHPTLTPATLARAAADLNWKTDPFHPHFEKVFVEWIHHVNRPNANGRINLIEEGRLMEEISKIYVCRVDAVYDTVLKMADTITITRARNPREIVEQPNINPVIQTVGQMETESGTAVIYQPCVRLENLTSEQILLLCTTPQPNIEDVPQNVEEPVAMDFPDLEPGSLDIDVTNGHADLELHNRQEESYRLKLRKRGSIMVLLPGWNGSPKKRRRCRLVNPNHAGMMDIEMSPPEIDDPMLLDIPLTAVLVGCDEIIAEDQFEECTPRLISVRKDFVDRILATNMNELSSGESFAEFVNQALQVIGQTPDFDFTAIDEQRKSANSLSSHSDFRRLWKTYMHSLNSEFIKALSVLPRLAFHHDGTKQKLKEATAELERKVSHQIGQSATTNGDDDVMSCNNEKHDVEAIGFEILKELAEAQNRVESERNNVTPNTGLLSESNDSGFAEFDSLYSSQTQSLCTPSGRSESDIRQLSQDSGIDIEMDHDGTPDYEIEMSKCESWPSEEQEGSQNTSGVSANCIFNNLFNANNKDVGMRFYSFLQEMSNENIATIRPGSVKSGIKLTEKGRNKLASQTPTP